MSEGTYALSKADENRENGRLKNLEAASDAFTIRHLEAVGVTAGWRCLEVGAAESVVATRILHDLMTRWRSAGMLDSYYGRRLPAVIGALEFSDVG